MLTSDTISEKADRLYKLFREKSREPAIQELRHNMLLYGAYLVNKREPPADLVSSVLGGVVGMCIGLEIPAPKPEWARLTSRLVQLVVSNASNAELDEAERIVLRTRQ